MWSLCNRKLCCVFLDLLTGLLQTANCPSRDAGLIVFAAVCRSSPRGQAVSRTLPWQHLIRYKTHATGSGSHSESHLSFGLSIQRNTVLRGLCDCALAMLHLTPCTMHRCLHTHYRLLCTRRRTLFGKQCPTRRASALLANSAAFTC